MFMTKHKVSAAVIASVIAASFMVTPGTSFAAEGCGGPFDEATPTFDVITPDGLVDIRLTYHPHDQCADGEAFGAITTAPVGSELWVDRQSPYQGFLFYTQVDPGDFSAWTPAYNDNGKQMRACGTSGKGHPIVCTRWY